MQKPNSIIANDNLKKMLEDARGLLHTSTTLTGEKAVNVRRRGMCLLDIALAIHQPKKGFCTSTTILGSTSDYVKDNPLNAMTFAACFGLITGVIMGMNN